MSSELPSDELVQLQREQDLEAKKLELAELRCRRLRAELEVSNLRDQQQKQQKEQQPITIIATTTAPPVPTTAPLTTAPPVPTTAPPVPTTAPPVPTTAPLTPVQQRQNQSNGVIVYRPLTADASAVYATNARNGHGLYMIPKTGTGKKSVACAALVNTPIVFAAVNDQYLYVMLRRFPHLPLTIMVISKKSSFHTIQRCLSMTNYNTSVQVLGLRAREGDLCGILSTMEHWSQPEENVFNLATGAYVGSVVSPATRGPPLYANRSLFSPPDPLSPVSITVASSSPSSSCSSTYSSSSSFSCSSSSSSCSSSSLSCSSSSSSCSSSLPSAFLSCSSSSSLSVEQVGVSSTASFGQRPIATENAAPTTQVGRPTAKELLKHVENKTLEAYAQLLLTSQENYRQSGGTGGSTILRHFAVVVLALHHLDADLPLHEARMAFLKDSFARNNTETLQLSQNNTNAKFNLAIYIQALCASANQKAHGTLQQKAVRLLDFLLRQLICVQDKFAPILVLQVPRSHYLLPGRWSRRPCMPLWCENWSDSVVNDVLNRGYWTANNTKFMSTLQSIVCANTPQASLPASQPDTTQVLLLTATNTASAAPLTTYATTSATTSAADVPLITTALSNTLLQSRAACPASEDASMVPVVVPPPPPTTTSVQDVHMTGTVQEEEKDVGTMQDDEEDVGAMQEEEDGEATISAAAVTEVAELQEQQQQPLTTHLSLPHTTNNDSYSKSQNAVVALAEQKDRGWRRKRSRDTTMDEKTVQKSSSRSSSEVPIDRAKTKRQKRTRPISTVRRQQMSLQRWLTRHNWSIEQVHESVCESWTGVSLASLRNWLAGSRHQTTHFIKHINDAVLHFRKYNIDVTSSADEGEEEIATTSRNENKEYQSSAEPKESQLRLLDLEAIATAVLSGTDRQLFGVP